MQEYQVKFGKYPSGGQHIRFLIRQFTIIYPVTAHNLLVLRLLRLTNVAEIGYTKVCFKMSMPRHGIAMSEKRAL